MTTSTITPTIRCGHCRGTHDSSSAVRACAQATADAVALDARIRAALGDRALAEVADGLAMPNCAAALRTSADRVDQLLAEFGVQS